MSSPTSHILLKLRALRRRIMAQRFARWLASCALAAGALLVAAGLVNRWLLGRLPWDATLAAWVGAAALATAAVVTLSRQLAMRDVAAVIDRLGGTRDRFLTALTFAEELHPTALRAAAVRECERFIAGRDFRVLLRWRMPREAPWLLVPAVALAMLQWEARIAFDQKARALADGQSEAAPTAERLEQLARDAEKRGAETNSDELKKIAEQLRKSAEELRAAATDQDAAQKAALAQLSQLEQLVQEMQQAAASLSPEEMKELAKALAENEATKEAAAAMQAGNLAEAAKQLEEAAKEEPSAEEARQTLDEAMQRLAQQRQLSQQLQQLAEQLQQRTGAGPGAKDALQKLAQMLRQAGQRPQPGQGQQGAQQSLQSLLSALQNMKFGDPSDQTAGAQPNSQGQGQISMQAFNSGAPNGEPMPGDAQLPSGQPGSEKDFGTTATPFGEQDKPLGEKGADVAMRGRLGEGETLSTLLPAAGDTSKSARRYKELYEAMAPAAEQAVVQEDLPLGSRFFIKRYFESIRPAE